MGLSRKRKNSHMPPRGSNSSPVAFRKDHDSFILSFLYIWFAALFPSFLFQRISCLFAKFKDLVVREDDNNIDDSDPKVKNEKGFSKLKDLVGEEDNNNSNPKATSLTEQQKVFELWCYFYKKTYSNQAEKKMRFGIFQKALSPPKPSKELGSTYPGYADLTQQELRDSFTSPYHQPPAACYVLPSYMDSFSRRTDVNEYRNVVSSDEEDYWHHEECSDHEECWDEDYALYLRLLEQSSDGTL